MLLLMVPRLYAGALLFPHHEDEMVVLALATLAVLLVTICVSVNRPSVSNTVTSPARSRPTDLGERADIIA
jgi:hypothetical protein